MDHDSGFIDVLLPLTLLWERRDSRIIIASCLKVVEVLVPPSSSDTLYEQFFSKDWSAFNYYNSLGVALCPCSLLCRVWQSSWYTNLILDTWLDQPSLFLRRQSKLSLWRQYGSCSKWVHVENHVAIISSNECAREAHGVPVNSMLITWCEEDLICPMSCKHLQLPDASVSD